MRMYSGLLDGFAYAGAYQRLLAPAAPAAGAQLVVKAPGDQAYRIISGVFTLATSATVAARSPHLQLLDGDGNVFGDFEGGTDQAASLTTRYSIAPGYAWSGAGRNIAIPSVFIYPGFSFALGADNLQADDQVSLARILVDVFEIGRDSFSVSGIDAGEPETVS